MTDKTPALPTIPDGGSYAVNPDGTLTQLEAPTLPPPGKSATAAAAAGKAASAPAQAASDGPESVTRAQRRGNTPAA